MAHEEERYENFMRHQREDGVNARFWIFLNRGYVKVTLRPNQTLAWARGGEHEEGYFSEGVEFYLDADGELTREEWSRGQDCDGPHSHGQELATTALDCQRIAATRDAPDPECPRWPVTRPKWAERSYEQRDLYAEAAGY